MKIWFQNFINDNANYDLFFSMNNLWIYPQTEGHLTLELMPEN